MRPAATVKLGEAFGITVLLHWTLLWLPLVIVWLSAGKGDSLPQTAIILVTLIIVMGSVLLHEFGHALAARRLGIPILDIILTPVCGLARLGEAPSSPRHEILVAVAGPLVNGILAGCLAIFLWVSQPGIEWDGKLIGSNLLLTLFWVNVSLSLLNLVPAFPMDGGRILRALLAMRYSKSRATWIAVRLGQALAAIGCIVGIGTGVWPLVVIGLFLLMMAQQELFTDSGPA